MWPLTASLCPTIIIACFTATCGIQLPNKTFIVEAPLKIRLVEQIVKKICNISLDAFANKSHEEKTKLIVKLEEKLKESAQALGDHGAKYVQLIMRGIKAKADISEYSTEKNIPQKVTHVDSKLSKTKINTPVLVSGSPNETKLGLRAGDKQKEKLTSNIATKLEYIAKNFLKKGKTLEEREANIEKVKQLMIKSATHTGTINQENLDKYIDLVARGVEIMMNKKEGYRRDIDATHNIELGKDSLERENVLNIAEFDLTHNNELGYEISSAAKTNSRVISPDKKSILPTNPVCNDTLEQTCQKIKLIKTRNCSSSNNEFSILKLCDSKTDCFDASDEKDCALQASEIIRTADRLISYIDTSLSNKCYPDLTDRSLLSKQNKVLSVVLKQQLSAIEKSSVDNSGSNSRRNSDVRTGSIKETVHEAVHVVDSLTSALGTSMCRAFDDKGSRISELLVTEKPHYEGDESFDSNPDPEICKCNGKGCAKTCTSRCGDVCFEMYSLGQLTCQAVSGEEHVSLDLVCDGKLDCFDENDEKDCSIDASLAKFEATNMYNYILKDIEAKLLTVTYNVRSKFQNLHAAVTKYQKISLQRNAANSEVKLLRNAMFEELKAVYESAVRYIKNEVDLFDMRFSLSTMKERLISALKRSNTGNEKIKLSDGCLCRGYDCALPKCSKACVRACSIEPQLTRFFCGKLTDPLNNSLPIELMCNGKANCPNGEDEKDCKTGACRSLHLKQLAQKLQDSGRDREGTGVGEALRLWRIKALATLAVAEEDKRPTPPILHEILRGLLQDLVKAYSLLEDKRDNTSILQEFYKWSHVVKDTLKSCNA